MLFSPIMDLCPHIEKFSRRLAEVEAALSDPKVFVNKQRAQELSREYARSAFRLFRCGFRGSFGRWFAQHPVVIVALPAAAISA